MESGPSQRLVAALRRASPESPKTLEVFDRIAGAECPRPDFLEWSARIGEALQTERLTYYFDAEKHSADELANVGDRFVALAAALDMKVPPTLATTYAALVPRAETLLQAVLGIDAAAPMRVKLYLIMRGPAPDLVDGMLAAVGAVRPSSLDAARVYILGLDFGAEGLADAKLYYRLDVARLPRVVANLGEVREVYEATREVVLQRCLLADRSQIYLHADNDSAITKYLARSDATRQLITHARSVNVELAPQRIAPWIISFAFRDHRLVLDTSNVYFHLVDTPRPAEYDRGGV